MWTSKKDKNKTVMDKYKKIQIVIFILPYYNKNLYYTQAYIYI